jgi:hypothetical protein
MTHFLITTYHKMKASQCNEHCSAAPQVVFEHDRKKYPTATGQLKLSAL